MSDSLIDYKQTSSMVLSKLLKNQVCHFSSRSLRDASLLDAWLLTNGYNNGIVQLVGQAIHKVRCVRPDQTITAIGICKWGCVPNIDSLARSTKESNKQVKILPFEKKPIQLKLMRLAIDCY